VPDGYATTRQAILQEANTQYINNRISTSRYNCCNFVPKTVFMQFRRLANVYFLVMSMLMYVGTEYPEIFTSPLSPGSTMAPLLVIVFLTCIKEGLEDLKRHRSDRTTNGRTQQVLNPAYAPTLQPRVLPDEEETEERKSTENMEDTASVSWLNLRVGQYVVVRDKEQLPADVVVLCSSNGDGCFIETANIDGETNLKIREVPMNILDLIATEKERRTGNNGNNGNNHGGSSKNNGDNSSSHLRSVSSSSNNGNSAEATYIDILRSTSGSIEFEAPNRSIHTFVGTLRMSLNGHDDGIEVTAPLSSNNFLLRGATLKNTGWIVGVVVYTGFDTKIMQNRYKVFPFSPKVYRYRYLGGRVAHLIPFVFFSFLFSLSFLSFFFVQRSRSARTKMSRMEVLVNKCIRLVLLTQLAITIVSMCLALYVNYYLYQNPPWYLFPTIGTESSVDSMDNSKIVWAFLCSVGQERPLIPCFLFCCISPFVQIHFVLHLLCCVYNPVLQRCFPKALLCSSLFSFCSTTLFRSVCT